MKILKLVIALLPEISDAVKSIQAAAQDGKVTAAEVMAALLPVAEALVEALGLKLAE